MTKRSSPKSVFKLRFGAGGEEVTEQALRLAAGTGFVMCRAVVPNRVSRNAIVQKSLRPHRRMNSALESPASRKVKQIPFLRFLRPQRTAPQLVGGQPHAVHAVHLLLYEIKQPSKQAKELTSLERGALILLIIHVAYLSIYNINNYS